MLTLVSPYLVTIGTDNIAFSYLVPGSLWAVASQHSIYNINLLSFGTMIKLKYIVGVFVSAIGTAVLFFVEM
jgi:hypothetical protein